MRYSIHPDITATEINDEIVLLHPRTSMMFTLDAVGATVWQALNEHPRTLDELVQVVTEQFDVTPERATADLQVLQKSLLDEGLIVGQE